LQKDVGLPPVDIEASGDGFTVIVIEELLLTKP
jgi:hypothetical protein